MSFTRRELRVFARGLLPVLAAFVVSTGIVLPGRAVAEGAEAKWRFQPAQAPPPPEGTAPAPYGVPLGRVGEISFWAPDRGLLITGGTEEANRQVSGGGGPVPAGLYAWDGVSWHQLASVCGGAEGRIVWAGSDEWWTISNQRAGQQIGTSVSGEIEASSVSLCHFVGDAVVGSYAVPLEEAESWRQMTGGACYSPSNCWFGGMDGVGVHTGAFHLHWNGSTVTAVYEAEDHSVTSMALFGGQVYEAVQLGVEDSWLSEAERKRPAVLHAISASGQEQIFSDVPLISEAGERLPEYGEKIEPEALQGFDLALDAPAGASADTLWAAADPSARPPATSKPARMTIMQANLAGGSEPVWSQLVPSASGATPLNGVALAGSLTQYSEPHSFLIEQGTSEAIAPEPGGKDAWLSLRAEGQLTMARVALMEPTTCETEGKQEACTKLREDTLPEAEAIGPHGTAGPIVCPGAHDCWLATFAEPSEKAGWLFHLSSGIPEELDTDPVFDGAGGVVNYRPPDSGVPAIYPDGFAVEDSLANQQVVAAPTGPAEKTLVQHSQARKARRLVKRVESRLLHRSEVVVKFVLAVSARVQLIARRRKAVVAQTPRKTLHAGRHSISLQLNPDRWPTKLQFEAKPVRRKSSANVDEGQETSESSQVET